MKITLNEDWSGRFADTNHPMHPINQSRLKAENGYCCIGLHMRALGIPDEAFDRNEVYKWDDRPALPRELDPDTIPASARETVNAYEGTFVTTEDVHDITGHFAELNGPTPLEEVLAVINDGPNSPARKADMIAKLMRHYFGLEVEFDASAVVTGT